MCVVVSMKLVGAPGEVVVASEGVVSENRSNSNEGGFLSQCNQYRSTKQTARRLASIYCTLTIAVFQCRASRAAVQLSLVARQAARRRTRSARLHLRGYDDVSRLSLVGHSSTRLTRTHDCLR